MKASPVSPPDSDDFAWGQVFGSWESTARDAVEGALEQAIINGDLDPAKTRWRKVAAQVCADTRLQATFNYEIRLAPLGPVIDRHLVHRHLSSASNDGMDGLRRHVEAQANHTGQDEKIPVAPRR